MKTMDNTIKYYELLMKYDDISDYKKYEYFYEDDDIKLICVK